jgi:hypothetical protein
MITLAAPSWLAAGIFWNSYTVETLRGEYGWHPPVMQPSTMRTGHSRNK